MEILNISVKGFRNITSARLELKNITALLGLNGYGKSNLINAINTGFDFIICAPEMKTNIMASKNMIPLLKNNAGMDYSFEIEAIINSNSLDYTVKYGYSFSWETDSSISKIIEEHLLIKGYSNTTQYSSFIVRDEKKTKYRSSEKGRCAKQIKIDDNALVLNKLVAYDKLFYLDIIRQLNNIQFYVEKHLDPRGWYVPDPLVFKGSDILELDAINNIPRTIWTLKNEHEKEYDILQDSFMKLFPSIKNIICKEHKVSINSSINISDDSSIMFSDNIYTLVIQDSKLTQPISFERLSDGTKRVFLSLTYALLAGIKGVSVIVFEEPENSIHPSLLQNYLRLLDRISGNCKIIFTSHSPYLAQYLLPENIYIGLLCDSGQVDFRKIVKSDSLIRLANKNKQSIGDLVFSYISFSNANELLSDYIGKPSPGFCPDDNNDDIWLDDSSIIDE